MGIRIRHEGNFEHIEKFLSKANQMSPRFKALLEKYGRIGVDELSKATPVDTGLTAASWYYEIEDTRDGYRLHWNNSNIQNGINIAILIQYGHATTGGTYVEGRDYMNPALQEAFEGIATDIWKEVTS